MYEIHRAILFRRGRAPAQPVPGLGLLGGSVVVGFVGKKRAPPVEGESSAASDPAIHEAVSPNCFAGEGFEPSTSRSWVWPAATASPCFLDCSSKVDCAQTETGYFPNNFEKNPFFFGFSSSEGVSSAISISGLGFGSSTVAVAFFFSRAFLSRVFNPSMY